jgi:hypothetical protein
MRSRPAPLVAPAGPRRWYFPLAAAAIITLAVAVTVQVERQKPDDEFLAQAPLPAPAPKEEVLLLKEQQQPLKVPAPKAASPRRSFTPDPGPAAPAPQSADALRDLAKSSERQVLAEPAVPVDERVRAQVQARRDEGEAMRMEAELQVKPGSAGIRGPVSSAPVPSPSAAPPVAAAARAAPSPQAKPAPEAMASRLVVNPERWLEQIAELRKEGKHDDADKLLAEFRKSYPDYRISDEMRAKVEKK